MRSNKKSYLRLLLLFVLVALLSIVVTGLVSADEDPVMEGCAFSPGMLDGQGRYSVSGLGRYTVAGLGRYTVAGLGRYSVAGLGLTQEEIDQNLIDPNWIIQDAIQDATTTGGGFNSVKVAYIIVDEFEEPPTDEVVHGELVDAVVQDLLDALNDELEDEFGQMQIDVFHVNISDGAGGFAVDDIASRIDAKVQELEADGYTHFIFNMSFAIIPCEWGDFNFNEFIEWRNTPDPEVQDIEPILECISIAYDEPHDDDDEGEYEAEAFGFRSGSDHHDGPTYIAHFGYLNHNDDVVVIPESFSYNKLFGSDDDPATIFQPGRHKDVFRVPFEDDEELKWKLKHNDHTNYAFANENSPLCDEISVFNGSFEKPVITNPADWDIFGNDNEELEWTVEWLDDDACGGEVDPVLELQNEDLLDIDAPDGHQYAELDTDCQGPGGSGPDPETLVRISQLIPTIPGEEYEISFYYRGRPHTSGLQKLKVEWDGEEIYEHPGNPSKWKKVILSPFTAEDSLTEIAFSDVGHDNSYGILLDRIRIRRLVPEPEGAVVPTLECVVWEDDETYTAIFGYENPNDENKWIGVGDDNYFSPGDEDRGQTRLFEPGSNPTQFLVHFTGGSLTWNVDGNSVTADTSEELQCAELPDVNDKGLIQYLIEVLGIDPDHIGDYLADLLAALWGSEDDPLGPLSDLLDEYLENTNNPLLDFAMIACGASGNYADIIDPNLPFSPANMPQIISISALLNDAPGSPLWELSQYGNIAAPGAWYQFTSFSENFYGAGTSFSSPIACMVAALYLTYPDPDKTVCEYDDEHPPLVHSVNTYGNEEVLDELACQAPPLNDVQPECPAGTYLVAKFNVDDDEYVPEVGPNGVVITNGTLDGGDWTSVTPISHVLIKGGPGYSTDEYDPLATAGTFSNANLPKVGNNQTPDISNIQFCAPVVDPEEETGKITVIKDAENADGTDFTIALGGEQGGDIIVDDFEGDNDTAHAQESFVLPTGDYSLEETLIPDGWVLEDVECTTNDTSEAIDDTGTLIEFVLDAGEEVTCTFYNVIEGEETGKITVIKDAEDADGTDFTIALGGEQGGDIIVDDFEGDNDTAHAQESFVLPTGDYSLEETLIPDGWVLEDVECTTNDTSEAIDDTGTLIEFVLDAGEEVTCTFYNVIEEEETGKLTVIKQVVYEADYDLDSDQDFIFSLDGPTPDLVADETFYLDDPLSPDGDLITDTKVLELEPGTYKLSEGSNGGWLQELNCVGDDDYTKNLLTANLNVEAGEDITCTFTNTRTTGELTIAKIVQGGAAGSNWEFFVAEENTPMNDADNAVPFLTDNTIPGAGGSTVTYVLPADGYEVGEVVPAGYTLNLIDCNSGVDDGGLSTTPPANNDFFIILTNEGDITCTFTNVKLPPPCRILDPLAHLSATIEPTGNPNEWRARVFNTSTCKYDVGFASYKKPNNNQSDQVLHSSDTELQIGQGETILILTAPACATQLDVFFDASHLGVYPAYAGQQANLDLVPLVLPAFNTNSFGPYGNLYAQRLLAYKHVAGANCQPPPSRSITIQKSSDPGYDNQVYFTGELGPFNINGNDGQYTFPGLAPDVYTVTETVPDGWDLDRVTCNGQNMQVINNGVNIDVTSSNATCTFYNVQEEDDNNNPPPPVDDDKDNDGVKDDVDECDDVPANTANGCPLPPPPPDDDKDDDGVKDDVDQCDDVPANTADGCPLPPPPPPTDTDQDGVPDNVDECDDVPANTQNGCPLPPPPPPTCEPNPDADLRNGLTFIHDPNTNALTVKGQVKNQSVVCSYDVGLASYAKANDNVDDQSLHDSDTGEVGPGEQITFTVEIPDCHSQVDLFYGDVLNSFAGGARYGSRLLDAKHITLNNFCGEQEEEEEAKPVEPEPEGTANASSFEAQSVEEEPAPETDEESADESQEPPAESTEEANGE